MDIMSRNLVPGDHYLIENEMKIPCDTLLINEMSLTGESIPIPKE